MKKILSILAFIVVGVLSANASGFYVFFKKDYLGKHYYSNSCLPCTPMVKILSMTAKAQQLDLNKNGGVQKGAIFNITEYSENHSEIYFFDNAGKKRNDVAGVNFAVIVRINDKDTIDFESSKMAIIPAGRINTPVERENEIRKTVCYDKKNKALIFSTNISGRYMFLNKDEEPIGRPAKIEESVTVKQDEYECIYLILSENGKYMPDITIPIKDFKVKETWWDQHKNKVLWSFIAIFVVLVLFILAIFFYRRNKRTKFPGEKNNTATDSVEKDRDADSDLHTTIKGSKESVGSYYKTLMEDSNIIKKKLDNIESLVSNTEDKQKISQLTKTKDDLSSKINVKIKEIGDLKETIIRKDKEITDLNVVIDKIKKASAIVGAERLIGYEHFLSFAKHILGSCAKAEQLCYSFNKSHPAEEQLRLEGYFCEYLMSKPTNQILDWNSILSTLDLNGYIKAPQFAVYIKSKADKEKIDFLCKQFFENVVRPYVSSVLVLLEQLRASEIVGVVNSVKQEFDVAINELLTLCKGEGVVVDFHKLLEPISSYELVEIADNIIPLSVERNIKKDQHDVVLFVQKYAVNSRVSDTKEKTICYMIL